MKLAQVWILALLLGLSGCSSSEKAPPPKTRRAPSKLRQSPKTNKDSTPAPKASPAPILAKAIIQQINEERDREDGWMIFFNILEIDRGRFEQRQIVMHRIKRPRKYFPWIRNNEYEGSEVYLHIRRRGREYYVDAFSQSANGPITLLR